MGDTEAAMLLGRMIRQCLPDMAERRRYALLQAAATIHAGWLAGQGKAVSTAPSLLDAEFLLEKIEKREKAEAKP